MNSRILVPLAALGTCLLLAACSSYPEYPITYQIPIGAPYATSDYGLDNVPINAIQVVPSEGGTRLYYSMAASTNVMVYVVDNFGPYPGGPMIARFHGNSYSSSVVPSGGKVAFIFAAIQPVVAGTIQLTVSDSSLPEPVMSTQFLAPPTQYTTTTTTTQQSVVPVAQPAVSISPTDATVAVGQPVTITVSGGAGTGAFVWGGAATASGWSNLYTFNAPGTYTISVYRTGDATYSQSNMAAATVNVTPPAAPPPSPYSGNPSVTVTPLR